MDSRRTREDDVKIQPPRKIHVKSHSEGGLGSQPKPAWTLRSVNLQDDRASSSSSSLANNSSTQIPAPARAPSSSSDIPFSQQPYYQQQPNTSRLPPFRHKPLPPRPLPPRPQPRPRGLTLSPEPEIDRDLGPKTVPASVMNFPAGIRESVELRDSSTGELRQLWDVANGQRMEGGLGRFCLRLTRYVCLYLACMLYARWLMLTGQNWDINIHARKRTTPLLHHHPHHKHKQQTHLSLNKQNKPFESTDQHPHHVASPRRPPRPPPIPEPERQPHHTPLLASRRNARHRAVSRSSNAAQPQSRRCAGSRGEGA